MDLPAIAAAAAPEDRPNSAALLRKAQELEAAFLAEMLGHAGLEGGDADSGFSGGVGEAQFASFLRGEQAKLIVAKGGIGLAETLFRALQRPGND